MSNSGGGPRSFAASAVGWLLIAVIAYLFFGFFIGTLRWLFRVIVIVVILGGLGWLYFKLKDDD